MLGWLCALPAPTSAELPTTRIGYLPITDHLTLGIATVNGKFASQKIEAVRFTDWSTLSEALRSRSIEGAFLLAPLAFQVKRSGADVHIVLLGHRDGSALIVGTKSGIHAPADLRTKTLAIPQRFSTHNMLLHQYVSRNSLRSGVDFKILELAPSEMVAALSQSQIDGFIVAEPFGARAQVLGIGSVLVLSKDIWEHHPDCVLVLQDDFLKMRTRSAELVANLVNAGEFIEAHRSDAAELGAKFLGQPLDAMKRAMLEPEDRVTFHSLTPNKAELQKIYTYMKDEMSLFPDAIDMEALVEDDLAKRAYEMLGQ